MTYGLEVFVTTPKTDQDSAGAIVCVPYRDPSPW